MELRKLGETMKALIVPLIFLTVTACSNRGVYEGIQASNQFECSKLPPTQYDECMQRANTPYQEYERNRTEALEQQ
tara:strand:- start:429 stop:656 length:228 start_codon:yes stop_codon:yes gene_type:complete